MVTSRAWPRRSRSWPSVRGRCVSRSARTATSPVPSARRATPAGLAIAMRGERAVTCRRGSRAASVRRVLRVAPRWSRIGSRWDARTVSRRARSSARSPTRRAVEPRDRSHRTVRRVQPGRPARRPAGRAAGRAAQDPRDAATARNPARERRGVGARRATGAGPKARGGGRADASVVRRRVARRLAPAAWRHAPRAVTHAPAWRHTTATLRLAPAALRFAPPAR